MVGASTGLQFTATVVAKLVTLLPLIVVSALMSTLIGAIGGLLYMRLTGIDRTTAFFATVPGGVVETMTLAPRYGGHLEPIMVAQTTRVALIVVFAPFLVLSFVGGGDAQPARRSADRSMAAARSRCSPSRASSQRFSRARARRTPGSWRPFSSPRCCSDLGLLDGRMPDVLLIAAQIVIGSSLGAQFRPAFLTRLFGLLWASFLVVLLAAGAMGLVGAGIAWLIGYPMPTMILATAPAGLAEMMLTGKLLGLDATVIAGFQLARIIIVLIWWRTALQSCFEPLADWALGKVEE